VKLAGASFPGLGYRLPLWPGAAGRQSVARGGVSVAHHSQQVVARESLTWVRFSIALDLFGDCVYNGVGTTRLRVNSALYGLKREVSVCHLWYFFEDLAHLHNISSSGLLPKILPKRPCLWYNTDDNNNQLILRDGKCPHFKSKQNCLLMNY